MAELNTLSSLLNDVSCVAYWRLEDVNATKGAFTLTNNNTVTFTAAKHGNGANLGTSNTNKSLSIANNLGITNGNCSISTWVRLNTEIASGVWTLASKSDSGTNIKYQIAYEFNSGTRRLRFSRVRIGSVNNACYFNVALGTSDWVQLVLTYDGTTVKGYVNGVEVASVGSSGNGAGGGSSYSSIGADSTSEYASAIIDDIAIFSRVLTAAEILTLYKEQASAWWMFL